ncbi:hypothetical protein ACIHFE_28350 [Streptomyces sp. NPDC052396]|uniref:hypothetical protein n=1 Tax=Streptomyces sp. NPDC052396 TaxID=3365689 RepID=UPI0037D7EBF2
MSSTAAGNHAAPAGLLDASAEAGATWNAPAQCEWLRAGAFHWLGKLLRRGGFRWKRTRDSVRHQADPVPQQAARARLEDLRPCGRRRTPAAGI